MAFSGLKRLRDGSAVEAIFSGSLKSFVPDKIGNLERQEIAAWEALGNTIPAYVTPTAATAITPTVAGLEITLGAKSVISTNTAEAFDPQCARFPFRWVCVPRLMPSGQPDQSFWSEDDGRTWLAAGSSPASGATAISGPSAFSEKSFIYTGKFGQGTLRAFSSPAVRYEPAGADMFRGSARQSVNNWDDVTTDFTFYHLEDVAVNLEDDLSEEHRLYPHHGIVWGLTGQLIATVYYAKVSKPATGWPGYSTDFINDMRRHYLCVMTSTDWGVNFDNAVDIMGDVIETRGRNTASEILELGDTIPIFQEGANESDIARSKTNTELVVVARTGARSTGSLAAAVAPLNPTPFLIVRSADDGVTWTKPRQLATLPEGLFIGSANPTIGVLGNGVWFLVSGRPGCRIYFSDDNAHTWKGEIILSAADNYTDAFQSGYDEVTCIFQDTADNGKLTAQYITVVRDVDAGLPGIDFWAETPYVQSGQASRLAWFTKDVENLKIAGGGYGAMPGQAIGGYTDSTAAITAETTFTLHGNLTGDLGVTVSKTVTVKLK